MQRWKLGVAAAACATAFMGWSADKPAVFWASSPVRPGEAVMVQGWGWGGQPKIELQRLKDSGAGKPGETVTCSPILCNDEGLSFVVPQGWNPGLYRFSVVADNGRSEPADLNAPQPWWHQGDCGKEASPGGWLRLFGSCLSVDGQAAVSLRSGNSERILKPSQQDDWSLTVKLPKDLPTGDYQVRVRNGCGGEAGWRTAADLRVVSPPHLWGDKTFDVTAFGAVANDAIDDTYAVQKALDAAGEAGGGTVSVPRGRFQLNGTLLVPRHVQLKLSKFQIQ